MKVDDGCFANSVRGSRTFAALIVKEAISALPFADRIEVRQIASSLTADIDFAICVPAKDEERFLPDSLASLTASVHRSGAHGAIVMLINNSADRSWRMARDILDASDSDYLIVNVSLQPDIADAPHARRMALDIGALLAADGALMTTDADTLVAVDWAAANLRHMRGDADLVCGSVSIEPQEYAALPEPIRFCGEVEAAYSAQLERLWQRWTVGTAPSFQIPAMGASLALPTARYREIGGMPTPSVAEDKALASLARRLGWSIKMAGDVTVETSGRLFARAAGGMGDALRTRATDEDPYCDEQMVPLGLLRRLADIWTRLPDNSERSARLQDVIEREPALQHHRMRLSQVLTQLTFSTDDVAVQNPSHHCLLGVEV
jgi:hypothetical protein